MKDILLTCLLLGMPLMSFADGNENGDIDGKVPSEELNWPKVTFTSTADGTDRNILPNTEVRVEVKIETDATNYKWLWENGSDSTYLFKAEDTAELDKAIEKKVKLTFTDSVGNNKEDSISFFIWPIPHVDDNAFIGIKDKYNPGNTTVKYIREGNAIDLQQPEGKGGYAGGWKYTWAVGGLAIDEDNPTIPSGINYTNGRADTIVTCFVQNTCMDSVWYKKDFELPITVFQLPDIPTLFIKKGNGATGTWIVSGYQKQMGNLKVALKNDNNIEDVFVIKSEEIHEANNVYCWFHSDYAKEHKDINERNLCLYTERNYGDSIRITSQLLMLDATNVTPWDGSTYPLEVVEPVADDEKSGDGENSEEQGEASDDGEQSRVATTFLINGNQTNQPQRGLNIVRLEDGTIRKIILK